MRLVIEIPDGYDLTRIQNGSIASKVVLNAVKNGTLHETVTEFADRCRECGKQMTGHWILVNPLQEDDGGSYMCDCCKCGHPYISPSWKFCPNCGAKMVEVGDKD